MIASKPKFSRLYLILAYGLTWIFWIPVALTKKDCQTSPILLAGMFLGSFGSGAAGIIMTYSEQGKEGGRDFWRTQSEGGCYCRGGRISMCCSNR